MVFIGMLSPDPGAPPMTDPSATRDAHGRFVPGCSALRAEVVASIRTGLKPEFLAELRVAPADPVDAPSLNAACISTPTAACFADASEVRPQGAKPTEPAAALNKACISRPTPPRATPSPEPDPASPRNPAQGRNAASVERML